MSRDSNGTSATGLPLFEYDPTPRAVLEPSHSVFGRNGELPGRVVLCFYADVLEDVARTSPKIGEIEVAYGVHDIWSIRQNGCDVAVLHPGVGAPAAAAMLEEVIAMGGRSVVAVGGSAIVSHHVSHGDIIVPTSAVRDEGTSFHYAPPTAEIEMDAEALSTATSVLTEQGVRFVAGKVWTTDGLYRETVKRVSRRREQGCLVVEMETAALAAVCRFRGVSFASLLYAGDDVSTDTWSHENWTQSSARRLTFDLALITATRLRPKGGRMDGRGGVG